MGGTTGKITHVGVAPEVTFGTAVGATSYLKYSSESIALGIEDLVEASLNAIRDEGASYHGLKTIAGDTVHEVHPAGLGILLRSALGAPVTTDNTGSYTHVYTPLATRNRATGTAIAGTGATTITVTGTPWTANVYIGRWCHIITGSGIGQWAPITANSTSALTCATSPAAASGDTFEIVDGPQHCALPPYTIEVSRDMTGATPSFQYKGMAINNLSFTIGVGQKRMNATASWLGQNWAGIAATTPTLPTTEPFMWDDCILGVGKVTEETATGGAAATIIHTGAGWTTNAYTGYIVLTTAGTGANQCRKIASNTADTLTVTPNWTVNPSTDTVFKVFYASNLIETIAFGWNNGLVGVPTLNNTNYISSILNDGFRTGTISKTIIPEDVVDFTTYYAGWTTREWCLYFHGAAITGAHYYDLIFYFPSVLFTAYPLNIGGGGRVTVAAGMKAKYSSTAGYFCKVILQNLTSSY